MVHPVRRLCNSLQGSETPHGIPDPLILSNLRAAVEYIEAGDRQAAQACVEYVRARFIDELGPYTG